jgi:hypothetical protein
LITNGGGAGREGDFVIGLKVVDVSREAAVTEGAVGPLVIDRCMA